MLSRVRKLINQRRMRKDIYSTQAYWDSKAAVFDDTAVSMWRNQSLNHHYEAEQIAVVQRQIAPIAGLRILDLGCGTGRFSRWFSERGARVKGIDFSSGSLDIARKLSAGDNPTYLHGSVFELDDENAYDLVFIWGVLTIACRDADELKNALVRIRRSLRPKGRVLLLEPVHSGFLHRVLDMELGRFLSVMKESGFVIDETVPMHFWPARLVLAYLPWPAWVTAPCYHVGQALMKLPGLTKLGDYWAIVARPSPDKN